MMTMSGLRPKTTLLLAALAVWTATPATAQFFFRPFVGFSAHRFEEPATELSPQEVVELLARSGFRLAQPPRYGDDVIVAIGVDRRGGHVRFVLDADDGEILERRRLDRGVAQAPAPRRFVEPAPPRRAASKAPEPPKPRAAAAHPPAPVRPAAPHVPPSEATKTPAAPAAATTPAPKPPASAPAAVTAAPIPPAPEAAAASPAPAAEWKAPSQ